MVKGEWWCLARMYFMTRWRMEVPKQTRCCCYSEVEAEWPDLNRGRRRGEVTKWWCEECGWLREKKWMMRVKDGDGK